MRLYNEIIRLYPGPDKITQKILNVFKRIPEESIDSKKTEIFTEKDFVIVKLYATEDKHCAFSLMIGLNDNIHKVFFDFIENINILYYEDFSSEEGLEDAIGTIVPILESNINRKDYYVKGNLCKTVITCDKYKIDEG